MGLLSAGTAVAADSTTASASVQHRGPEAQGKAQAAPDFDPLSHDKAYDSLFESDTFTLRGVIGTYRAEAPDDPSERISFYLANIDRTTQAFYSPNGYAMSPMTLGILRMKEDIRPWVRQAFTYAAAEPADHRKARFLACVSGRLRDAEAFDALAVAALQHPSSDVRASACWALARCGGRRAIPFLIELLYQSDALGDSETLPIGAAEALSFVTGVTFPKTTTSPERPGVPVVWQDPVRWRRWSAGFRGDSQARYEPAVEDALETRRAFRLDGKKAGS